MSEETPSLASLEAWKSECERIIAEIKAEEVVLQSWKAEIAEHKQHRQSWQNDLDAISKRLA